VHSSTFARVPWEPRMPRGTLKGSVFVRRVSGRHSFGVVSLRGGCNQFLSSSPILVESSRVKRSHGGCLVRNSKIGIHVLDH
jgi:hypothetical protein